MRDPKRIKRILNMIEKIWQQNPDLRLCQIIENAIGCQQGCIFHIEDNKVEEGLKGIIIVYNITKEEEK